jgi:hypothetical protein
MLVTEPTQDLLEEGVARAVRLLEECRSEFGFLASPTDLANYRRIWARDGCIMTLAALLVGRLELEDAARRTLLTLVKHQGPHGEIPSNVDPYSGRVSYGGTTGRVDADLWFLITCGEYVRASADAEFLDQVMDAVERVAFLLGAWEFNNRGLLFVPPTGDWADEYIQSGYVLYDQLLYLQAKRSLALLRKKHSGVPDHKLEAEIGRLRAVIRANYWLCEEPVNHDAIYHRVLNEKGRAAAACRRDGAMYWMPFFSPTGYGYRFDALANVLASLFGVANEEQARKVDDYITRRVADPQCNLLPAFAPVITPEKDGWKKLQVSFSHTFKNAPYEYHNGGLWPMVTGWHAASLAARSEQDAARRFLAGVHAANRSPMDGSAWSFPEFLHGQDHTPGGTPRMGWSAASAIIAHAYLDGKTLFNLDSPHGAVERVTFNGYRQSRLCSTDPIADRGPEQKTGGKRK